MLGSITLDLDPVDRGHSTVGRLGPGWTTEKCYESDARGSDSFINNAANVAMRSSFPSTGLSSGQSNQMQTNQVMGNVNQFPIGHSFNTKESNGYNMSVTAVENFNKNFTNQHYRRFGQRRPIMMCVYCGMKGHTIERYYKKHGYPTSFRFSKKSQTTVVVNQSIIYVGAEESFVHTNAIIGNDTMTGHSLEETVQSPLITIEQYNHLMSLLQNVPSYFAGSAEAGATEFVVSQATMLQADFNHSHDAQQASGSGKIKMIHSIIWIIDSGASNHICSHIIVFVSLILVDNVIVKVPVGVIIHITYKCSIVLGP
ncbi:hypothetical protein M9H77_34933 [Catharanthus roseus]|uniref:Uncharacterized protein n=1 Tax=Catharanthus roseus TaxID=4058 RepID=A0ACB9ZNA5_CATRO|nr:hypothetical protein M9H77_34933 [Catharanthus roseus]